MAINRHKQPVHLHHPILYGDLKQNTYTNQTAIGTQPQQYEHDKINIMAMFRTQDDTLGVGFAGTYYSDPNSKARFLQKYACHELV